MISSSVFCEINTDNQNYLIGMTVTRTFAGNYNVRLKFRNETEEKYKLKDLGNSSYALVLPQVKSLINENDIFYENEHPDIKIILSEKRDLTDNNNYYTKVNFKTKNDTFIHVEAYAQKSSKPSIILKKTEEEFDNNVEDTLPNWIWYIPVGVLSAICLLLLAKPDNIPEEKVNIKTKKVPEERENLLKNILQNLNTNINLKTLLKREDKTIQNESVETQKTQEQIEEEIEQRRIEKLSNETDNIIDELVKVVISQNDLVLMPGVPELPGLEKKFENTKIILKNTKIDIFDARNADNSSINKIPIIPEKMSLAERLKNKELIKEADEIIFEEKEIFFENISPIKDIPEKSEEIINNIENSDEKENLKELDEYDKLIEAFRKTLTIAHKINEDNDIIEEPDVIDAFGVSDNVGFSLVKYGNKVSLVGNIMQSIFVLKTFNPDELDNEPLFMEFCTQTPFSATYSVILNKFKALVKVTEDNISLIGEYD
ncbi:hypothetical protein IJG14_08485 [bacterium]|nr:hypothetical protein [bacterium]